MEVGRPSGPLKLNATLTFLQNVISSVILLAATLWAGLVRALYATSCFKNARRGNIRAESTAVVRRAAMNARWRPPSALMPPLPSPLQRSISMQLDHSRGPARRVAGGPSVGAFRQTPMPTAYAVCVQDPDGEPAMATLPERTYSYDRHPMQ